ncbi:MAG: hypothetical protein IPO19_04070 [Rhodoferax sp.]|nr:hypothetical protein [Rhodoferax sp.]
MRRYLNNCGWLLLPALLWNVVFATRLPAAFQPSEFWRDIPAALVMAENSLRLVVFVLPFFMPLRLSAPAQRRALLLFAAGTLIYFGSWLTLMAVPQSAWATSALGFTAPAWTPALWLGALALLGRDLYWGRFYRWWMYALVSTAFLVAHISHTAIVFARNT